MNLYINTKEPILKHKRLFDILFDIDEYGNDETYIKNIFHRIGLITYFDKIQKVICIREKLK